MTQDLLTEIDGAVARITFNRPAARNAINDGMITAMQRFLTQVESDPHVRCIVLTGAGDHFMAGGDVMGFRQTLLKDGAERRAEFEARIQSTAPLFLQIARMPQPIVARIKGAAAGAALGMVAAADFAVCGASSIFIVAHINIGASPDGSTSYYLPRAVGVRKAKELAILGEKVTAAEALAMGLVTRVVPDAELDSAVSSLVGKIVAAPATSVRRVKQLMDRSLGNSLQEQLRLEAESFAECASTPDFIEGVTAFAEKRKAVFNRDR